MSADSLLFGSMNEKSANSYFVEKINELTKNFNQKEKELILKNIENFKNYKENAK